MAQRLTQTHARLSIGALSRATGIPVETLRTWENRYGFPVPERKPSGHRLYPVEAVARLRRIAEAIARGHRAGQAVPASDEELAAMLEALPAAQAATPAPPIRESAPAEMLDLVEHFDSGRLTTQLLSEWSRTSPLEFLEGRVAPLARAVGDAWEGGRLDVRHEHFLSERLSDVLRTVRLPFEERAAGPIVVLATLPGEEHGLGLQMAALVFAWCGWQLRYLGTEVPLADLARTADDVGARVVAISISTYTRGAGAAAMLRSVRRLLPRRVGLLAGGAGAPEAKPGLDTFRDLRGLEAWARSQAR